MSSVTNMYCMFMDASAFNIDISRWDVSNVVTMDYMFHHSQVTSSFKQKLCGAAWVHSKANKKGMFAGSFGSISSQVCTSETTLQYLSQRSLTERNLVVRMPINTADVTYSNAMPCPKCGTFYKSGRVSCCAPGGAWYKNCGGAGSRKAGHRWFEGVDSCKRKFKADDIEKLHPLKDVV